MSKLQEEDRDREEPPRKIAKSESLTESVVTIQ